MADDASSINVITVIIADDHTLFREGMRIALSQKNDVKITGEAENGAQLLQLLKHTHADIILLDIQMPIMDGISALAHIRNLYIDIKVIMLTMHNGSSMISTLMESGANAYLTKTDDLETIYKAIKTVYTEDYYFNNLTNRAMLEGLRSKNKMLGKIIVPKFEDTSQIVQLPIAQKKPEKQNAPTKTKRKLLIAIVSLLLIALGIAASISINDYLAQKKTLNPSQLKQKANVPEKAKKDTLTPTLSQSSQTDSGLAKTKNDSTSLKHLQTIRPEETDSKLSNAKRDSIFSASLITQGHVKTKAVKNNVLPKKTKLPVIANSLRADSLAQNKLTEDSGNLSEQLTKKTNSQAISENLSPAKTPDTSRDEDKILVKNSIRNSVTISSNNYQIGALGGISDIKLKVKNSTKYKIDEVLVEVQYIQKEKMVYKTKTLGFHNIAPESSQLLEAPKGLRAVRIKYRIIAISSKELDL